MDQTILEDLGLTNAEVKTYLALLELGQTKTGSLIKKSGLQSSVVYNSLQSLKEKGLISWIVRGKIKYYQVTSPRVILDLLEERKKRFKSILPELLVRQKKAEEVFEAEVFEGTKAVLSMLMDWIKDAKAGNEYLFFSAVKEGYNKEIQEFFERYDMKRVEKKLVVKGLAHVDTRSIFAHRVKEKYLDMRYVQHPLLNGIAIFKNTVATMVWNEGQFYAVLVRSKAVADAYRTFFYDVWGHAMA
jgi:HTH-type transcriptional regulator, sugar sensing transcriptional regulator